MRFVILLAAATVHLVALLSLVASQARGDLINNCLDSGCEPIEGEMLLTTMSLTRTWTANTPLAWQPVIFGAGGVSSTGGGIVYSYSQNESKHARVSPHETFALRWIDGVDNGWWSFHSQDHSPNPGVPGWEGALHNVDSPDLRTRFTFVTGQYEAIHVESEITPLNGFDLTGMGLHVSRLSAFTGEWSIHQLPNGMYVSGLPLTIQLFGAPGEIPEPSILTLLSTVALAPCRRRCRA